jgi:hypothetical protein
VDVVAGATATVTVSYTGASNVTLNLRIDGLYITQSTQTYDPSVPLVSGRNGYLRVFVVANESNTARPAIRVRLSNPERTLTIPAPGPVPTRVDEGSLTSSWNIEIPAASIQPGLTITAELDPANEIKETNENDNRFPATGAKSLAVQSVPTARIRFISVQQGTAAAGDVSNVDRLTDLARRMHPLNDVDVDVDASVFPTGPLSPNGAGWSQLLSDLHAKRETEGSERIYYGVVKLGYGRSSGYVGFTLGQGVPTAAGWDDPADASRVVAHELGHVWGRQHSPCGPVENVGPYPYPGGLIGVYGMDVGRTELKPRSSPDIMSYCFNNPWISDYTYTEIMKFRASNTFVTAMNQAPQPSVLVWGRVVNGQPVLEPAFQIVARPGLPRRPGPYTVTATAMDGAELFRLTFDVAIAEDGPVGNGHFAFTVPLDQASAQRLQSLRLTGPRGSATGLRHLAQVRVSPSEEIVARREGASVSLRWDAAAYPMIMIRDPDTGEVLAFGRGGSALIQTAKGQLDLDVSDGIRSHRVRLAINRS